jgi:hypothetical protein
LPRNLPVAASVDMTVVDSDGLVPGPDHHSAAAKEIEELASLQPGIGSLDQSTGQKQISRSHDSTHSIRLSNGTATRGGNEKNEEIRSTTLVEENEEIRSSRQRIGPLDLCVVPRQHGTHLRKPDVMGVVSQGGKAYAVNEGREAIGAVSTLEEGEDGNLEISRAMAARDVGDESQTFRTVPPAHHVEDVSREPDTAAQTLDTDAKSSEPVTAIPALDKLDMSVVDNLPAAIRLELMQAYGLHSRTPRKRGAKAAAGGSGRKRKPPSSLPMAVKRQTIRSLAIDCSRDAVHDCSRDAEQAVQCKQVRSRTVGGSGFIPDCGKAASTAQHAIHGLTLSQVDPATFQELPEDVQQALRNSLPRSRDRFIAREEAVEIRPTRQQTLIHGFQVVCCLQNLHCQCMNKDHRLHSHAICSADACTSAVRCFRLIP